MMDCKIIQDLLPLYADGCCSEETKWAVEAHLKTCTDCRDALRQMTGEIPAPEASSAEQQSAQTMKSGMKKIRRRWLASLLAVVVLLLGGKIAVNQIRGEGLSLTNLNEQRICNAFLGRLVAEDYAGAYQYFDLDSIRRDWTVWNFSAEQMASLEDDGLAMFLKSTAALKEADLTNYNYLHVYKTEGAYIFYYAVTLGSASDTIHIIVNDQGIESVHGGNGSLPAPDALTQMSLWREYLWQDYSGCYFDPETHTYVYENQN